MILFLLIALWFGFLWLSVLCFNLHSRLMVFQKLAHSEWEYNEQWRDGFSKKHWTPLVNRVAHLEREQGE